MWHSKHIPPFASHILSRNPGITVILFTDVSEIKAQPSFSIYEEPHAPRSSFVQC